MVSAQVECYSCSYTYQDEENESDNSNCKTPTVADTNTVTCPTTSSCYVSHQKLEFPFFLNFNLNKRVNKKYNVPFFIQNR